MRVRVQVREFRAILNKLTPEKLEALLIEALRLRLSGRDELEEVTQTLFSVAMAQPHFASVYAHFATNYHAFFPAQAHAPRPQAPSRTAVSAPSPRRPATPNGGGETTGSGKAEGGLRIQSSFRLSHPLDATVLHAINISRVSRPVVCDLILQAVRSHIPRVIVAGSSCRVQRWHGRVAWRKHGRVAWRKIDSAAARKRASRRL